MEHSQCFETLEGFKIVIFQPQDAAVDIVFQTSDDAEAPEMQVEMLVQFRGAVTAFLFANVGNQARGHDMSIINAARLLSSQRKWLPWVVVGLLRRHRRRRSRQQRCVLNKNVILIRRGDLICTFGGGKHFPFLTFDFVFSSPLDP